MHHNETKTPLIRLAKRGVMEPWKAWCIRVGSILVALLLGGLVMSIALPEGSNIFSAYGTIIEGALGKKTAIRQTIKLAVPLLGTALAIAPCFKMRFSEPDLPRPYKVPGGKFGIALAIAAGLIIIALIVLPITAESLDLTGWIIVLGWLALGLVLMFITNARAKAKA